MHSLTITKKVIRPLVFDIAAFLGIYLVPAMVHYIAWPVYMIEPMRIVLVLAIVHTSRHNALFLALTLPFFSYLVSGHPFPLKAAIISTELIANVILFYLLASKTGSRFFSMLIAILASKMFCYLLYWVFISWRFVMDEAEPGFLVIQLCMSLVFSTYFLFQKKDQSAKP
jgi:hypothetical protein